MNKYLLLLLLPIGYVLLISSSKKKEVPPGTVELKEGFYMDEQEISNESWKEYVYWHSITFGESSEEYKASQIDYSFLNESDKALMDLYYSHPTFDQYPLVIRSKKQAQDYCKWRSDRVNEILYLKANKKTCKAEENPSLPQIYKYRLPTVEEWKSIKALPQLKKKKRTKYASKRENVESLKEKSAELIGFIPFIDLYENPYVNERGITNLHGNVKELVQEAVILRDTAEPVVGWHSLIDGDAYGENHSSQERFVPDISFRCACERVEN